MPPAVRRLTIYQGSDWSQVFACLDSAGAVVDLSGHSVRMTIRSGAFPGGYSAGDVTIAITTAASGLITASLTAEQTRVIFFADAVYDVETISAGGVVTQRFRGEVDIVPEASWA